MSLIERLEAAEVVAWEPVMVQYIECRMGGGDGQVWPWDQHDWTDVSSALRCEWVLPMRVTLANGQNIIVRMKK